jgi:methionine synthase II (cobalamin-independent)
MTIAAALARPDGAGRISKEELETQQDVAAKDSIEKIEATGSPIVSDGEQRWSSFATYAITETLAGTGLADSPEGRPAGGGASRSRTRCS